MPGRLRAIDLLRSCYHLGQPHVGADWQRHEVVALVVTGVFLCCAALLVGGVVIVALLAVGRLVIRAGLIVSAWLLGASLDVAGRPVLGTVAIAARQVPTRARFGSVATLSRAPGGVFLARLHAGVLLRVDLVAVERHRTNVSISRVRVKVCGVVLGACCAPARVVVGWARIPSRPAAPIRLVATFPSTTDIARDGEFSPPGRRCARLGLRATPSRKAQLDDSVPGPSGRRARPRPAARVPAAGRVRRRLRPGVGTTGAAGSRRLRPSLDATAPGARGRAGTAAAAARRLRSAAAGPLWLRRAGPGLRASRAVAPHG